MHHTTAIRLVVARDLWGKERHYPDLLAAARGELRRSRHGRATKLVVRGVLGSRHSVRLVSRHESLEWTTGDEVEFRDDLGLRIPLALVASALEEAARLATHGCHQMPSHQGDRHRAGPVWGIGCSRWGRWYRRPRTTQERRSADVAAWRRDEDLRDLPHSARPRPGRSSRTLVSA